MTDSVGHVQGLFLRNTELIKGFIYALLPSIAECEDVFQEVFLVVTEKAGQFEPGTDFLAWVRAIARNIVRRHLAARRSHGIALSDGAFESVMACADAAESEWHERRAALARCMGDVAPAARRVLELRYVEDLGPGEIARRTKRSVNGVSVALAKVRKFLRECVDRRLRASGGVA